MLNGERVGVMFGELWHPREGEPDPATNTSPTALPPPAQRKAGEPCGLVAAGWGGRGRRGFSQWRSRWPRGKDLGWPEGPTRPTANPGANSGAEFGRELGAALEAPLPGGQRTWRASWPPMPRGAGIFPIHMRPAPRWP